MSNETVNYHLFIKSTTKAYKHDLFTMQVSVPVVAL